MTLPPFIRDIVAAAITDTFTLGLYVVAAAALVVLLIPQIPMRDRAAMAAEAAKADGDEHVVPADAHL